MVEVLIGSPGVQFRLAPLEAAYQHKFKPATINGEPVKSVIEYKIDFQVVSER